MLKTLDGSIVMKKMNNIGDSVIYVHKSGFVQVMENLESHGIYYFNFQAWKVMEFK